MANTEEYFWSVVIFGICKLLPQIYWEVFWSCGKPDKFNKEGLILNLEQWYWRSVLRTEKEI